MHSHPAPASEGDLRNQLANVAASVETHLAAILDREAARGVPPRLIAAMRHGVLGGGKRFRPFLVIETVRLFGFGAKDALDVAAAVELIHCYSLVHDDLPAMDNDKLRRGQPTVWAAYDEWTAILVGDGLQSLAFSLLTHAPASADVRLAMVDVLAKAAGARGMVGGQALDLEAGKFGMAQAADADHILNLQAMKTGRLIEASCHLGALMGGATDAQRDALARYGDRLGIAFQISDDLLDAVGTSADVGKATGKDAAAGKATLVSLWGIEATRQKLDAAISDAVVALQPFGERAAFLIAAASYLAKRTS